MTTKYKAKPGYCDGIYFPSKKEMKRYKELRLLLNQGEITNLQLQPRYPLKVNGMLVCTYVADFKYTDHNGVEVVEDVKGFTTRVYKLKKKLVKAVYGIDIFET